MRKKLGMAAADNNREMVEGLRRELERANGFHELASERASAAEEQSALRWKVQDGLFAELEGAKAALTVMREALKRARGWVVTASSSRVARADLKAIDAALASISSKGADNG